MAYSDKVIDHYENPRNVGAFDKGDEDVGTGSVGQRPHASWDAVGVADGHRGDRGVALEAVAPAWLAQRSPRGRYAQLRDRTRAQQS